jgi:hypothetical protein
MVHGGTLPGRWSRFDLPDAVAVHHHIDAEREDVWLGPIREAA